MQQFHTIGICTMSTTATTTTAPAHQLAPRRVAPAQLQARALGPLLVAPPGLRCQMSFTCNQQSKPSMNHASMRALLQSERRGVYRTLLDQLIGVGCSQASHLTLFSRVAVVREPHRGQQAMLPTSPWMSSLGQRTSAVTQCIAELAAATAKANVHQVTL